jgi:hypothetical protein
MNGECVRTRVYVNCLSDDRTHLVPDKSQQASLAEIRSLRDMDAMLRGIAAELHHRARRTRPRTAWRPGVRCESQ